MSDQMTSSIKDAVKEKYGEAALRVTRGGSSCCGAAPASGSALRSDHVESLRCFRKPAKFPRKRCWPRWAAEIRPRWPN